MASNKCLEPDEAAEAAVARLASPARGGLAAQAFVVIPRRACAAVGELPCIAPACSAPEGTILFRDVFLCGGPVTPTTREQVLEVIKLLPAETSVEEAMERLYFLADIEAGLRQVEQGQVISHDEVKRRLLGHE